MDSTVPQLLGDERARAMMGQDDASVPSPHPHYPALELWRNRYRATTDDQRYDAQYYDYVQR